MGDRTAITHHVVEIRVRRIDNDGSRRLLGSEGDFLAAQVRRQLRWPHFRLFFGRQRREHHRFAVGSDLGLHGAGHARRGSDDAFRRTRGARSSLG